MTWIILWATDHTVGLQVSPEEEQTGLDLSEHGESSYQFPGVGPVMSGDGMVGVGDVT